MSLWMLLSHLTLPAHPERGRKEALLERVSLSSRRNKPFFWSTFLLALMLSWGKHDLRRSLSDGDATMTGFHC
jgi:hypothetical protein